MSRNHCHHPHLMHFRLVILNLQTSVAVCPTSCEISLLSVTHITFSSVRIRSNYRRYHTPWLTGPWGRTWRRVEWIRRYMDLRLYGEPFSVHCDAYLTRGCARYSHCLPVDPFLNQWNPRNMMRRKSMYYFFKWSSFVGNSSKKIFFGVVLVA